MHINGLSYHIETAGAGIPLLLLHGFTGSSQSWHDVVPGLSQHYRVIRVDLPGHGLTQTPTSAERCAMPLVAADLYNIMSIYQALPAHLLGYSLGGRLALYLGLHYRPHLRSLIIESGSPGLATLAERTQRQADDHALAERIERQGMLAFVNEWEQLPLWHSQRRLAPEIRLRLRTQRLQNDPHGLATSLRGMGTGVQPSLWEELPQLRVPTLLLTGADDLKFTQIAHAMQAHCPTCQVHTITAAGHTPHLEQPDAFVASVLAFLDNAP